MFDIHHVGFKSPQTHSFEVLDIMVMNLFERTFILRRPQTHSIGHFQVYLLWTWNPYLLFSGTRCLYVGSALWLSGLSFICFNVVERTLDKRFGRNPCKLGKITQGSNKYIVGHMFLWKNPRAQTSHFFNLCWGNILIHCKQQVMCVPSVCLCVKTWTCLVFNVWDSELHHWIP